MFVDVDKRTGYVSKAGPVHGEISDLVLQVQSSIQEMLINCGTETAHVLANILAGKL